MFYEKKMKKIDKSKIHIGDLVKIEVVARVSEIKEGLFDDSLSITAKSKEPYAYLSVNESLITEIVPSGEK